MLSMEQEKVKKWQSPASDMPPLYCRLIVSDLDGTLLNSAYSLTSATREAVEALNVRGLPLVIATGREWPAARMYYQDLGLETPYIGANGGFIYLPGENRAIHQEFLPVEDSKYLIDALLPYRLAVFCCDLNKVYMAGDEGQLQAFIHDRRFESVLCNDLSREGPQQLQKITLRGPEEELKRFRLERASEVSGVEMVFSGDTCLELIPQGVNKGKGVRITADYMKISLDDVVAVGDAMNDLPMLTEVGTGAAMGNAAEEVKEAAHYVVPTSDEDGAAKVFNACVPQKG
jgi:5-amino-6-(5-phospho-D-ribitylamino)uracil phosphatase